MTDVSADFRPPCWCPSRWAPTWRPHTNLYKFGENVSPHISHKKNCCDLNLVESLPFLYFQILDLIYWTVLIFYFDLFCMVWHWKPAINPYWPSLFGQDGWILASFFFCVFTAKKELGQYPAILASHLVNSPFLLLRKLLLGPFNSSIEVQSIHLSKAIIC